MSIKRQTERRRRRALLRIEQLVVTSTNNDKEILNQFPSLLSLSSYLEKRQTRRSMRCQRLVKDSIFSKRRKKYISQSTYRYIKGKERKNVCSGPSVNVCVSRITSFAIWFESRKVLRSPKHVRELDRHKSQGGTDRLAIWGEWFVIISSLSGSP